MTKKKRGPAKGTGGRPKIEIDWQLFEKLCSIQCTLIEISKVLGCSEDTIERHVEKKYGDKFAAVFKREASAGKTSLRRAQFKAALNGNVTMQIWLGKQYLGQKDKQEIKHDAAQGGVLLVPGAISMDAWSASSQQVHARYHATPDNDDQSA